MRSNGPCRFSERTGRSCTATWWSENPERVTGEEGRLKDVSPSFLNGTGSVSPVPPPALPVSWDSQIGRMFFVRFDVDLCLQETADDFDFLSGANLLLRVVKTAMLKSGTFHPAWKYSPWNMKPSLSLLLKWKPNLFSYLYIIFQVYRLMLI